jgi:dolichol-phosphate mannosyltransferase
MGYAFGQKSSNDRKKFMTSLSSKGEEGAVPDLSGLLARLSEKSNSRLVSPNGFTPGDFRYVMIIPTYNESMNIIAMIERVLALNNGGAVMVADDNSPDGTSRIVEQYILEKNEPVYLLERLLDRGRGPAGIEAMVTAIVLGFPLIGEMDADGSHAPEDLPVLLAGAAGTDGAIGSRLVPGGRQVGRPTSRVLLTTFANIYARAVLDLPYRDITSGFRLFTREALSAVPWEDLESRGPSVLQEILMVLNQKGYSFSEVPITFTDRILGVSTLNGKILRDSLLKLLHFRRRYRKGLAH